MSKQGNNPPHPTRRQALARIGRAAGALVVGCAALPATGCVGPLVDPDAVTELPLADVPQGRRVVFHAGRRVELRRDGQDIVAHLMICTHEFCDLSWYEPENNFRCACHEGRFFADGRPKSGPVTRPMFEIPARIAGDRLILGPAGELALGG